MAGFCIRTWHILTADVEICIHCLFTLYIFLKLYERFKCLLNQIYKYYNINHFVISSWGWSLSATAHTPVLCWLLHCHHGYQLYRHHGYCHPCINVKPKLLLRVRYLTMFHACIIFNWLNCRIVIHNVEILQWKWLQVVSLFECLQYCWFFEWNLLGYFE